MQTFYINSYAPLAWNKVGRDASNTLGIPPFVDGSIRREPDFEHEFPSISCLCRGNRFAPRLRGGDVVAYITKRNRYQTPNPHWRLTAILQVDSVLQSHADAANWYRQRNLPLPNNCWVRGNAAKPLEHSHRISRAGSYQKWDAAYYHRSKLYGTFIVCRPLFRDLSWSAPVVTDKHFQRAFGKRPGTLNPGALSISEYRTFIAVLGIDVLPA